MATEQKTWLKAPSDTTAPWLETSGEGGAHVEHGRVEKRIAFAILVVLAVMTVLTFSSRGAEILNHARRDVGC